MYEGACTGYKTRPSTVADDRTLRSLRPIHDIAEVSASDVLYHSAFGFARVDKSTPAHAVLRWERDAENLPRRVAAGALCRVYLRCEPQGFFHSALTDPQSLRRTLQESPVDALASLMGELPGPQAPHDLRDWVVGRGLMSPSNFDAWWLRVRPEVEGDPRFEIASGLVALRGHEEPATQALANPLLTAEARLRMAEKLRDSIGEDAFVEHATVALRLGGTAVRSAALQALEGSDGNAVLGRLAVGRVEGLVDAVRNGPWQPDAIHIDVHDTLFQRVLLPLESEQGLDGEDRLAAALVAWGAPNIAARLSRAATSLGRGQQLVEATLGKLAPRRAEVLALEMLRCTANAPQTSVFLADRLVAVAESCGDDLVAELASAGFRDAAEAVRKAAERRAKARSRNTLGDESTAPAADASRHLPSIVSGGEFDIVAVGSELARTLSQHHANHQLVNPSLRATVVHSNARVSIDKGIKANPLLPVDEGPGPRGDVYAAAALLVEAALGRRWSNGVAPDRVVPYLRHVADLPPSVLAVLDAAMQPNPSRRPAAYGWLDRWEQVVDAEERRAKAKYRANARVRVGFDTHIGKLKILHSQTNQDALYVSNKGSRSLLVVCDGISTATAGSGDLAAAIAAQVIANLWDQALPRMVDSTGPEITRFLDKALETANRAVCEAAIRLAGGSMEGKVPMGTTAVVTVAHGNRLDIAWLGDSRAYLVGPYGASLLTADQNQAGNRLGQWYRGERPHWDPAGYALVGYIGHFDEEMTPTPLEAQHASLTLLPDERLVVCSDGITDYLGGNHSDVAEALAACVMQDNDLEEAARTLVNQANRGGGGDNATVIVAGVSTD